MENLTPIKCPLKVLSKKGYTFTCGRSSVSVAPGSKGEITCYSCRRSFTFEVNSQYTPSMKPGERVEVKHEDT